MTSQLALVQSKLMDWFSLSDKIHVNKPKMIYFSKTTQFRTQK